MYFQVIKFKILLCNEDAVIHVGPATGTPDGILRWRSAGMLCLLIPFHLDPKLI